MTTGQVALVVAVALALVLGLARLATDGRFRGTHRVKGGPRTDEHPRLPVLHGVDVGHELGERATLLQFSSAFCAPCRATRRVLGEVAALVPGVAHVEVDAEHNLELVRRLGIMRTPTTLVLDATGHEATRAQGLPSKAQVLTALAGIEGGADA